MYPACSFLKESVTRYCSPFEAEGGLRLRGGRTLDPFVVPFVFLVVFCRRSARLLKESRQVGFSSTDLRSR